MKASNKILEFSSDSLEVDLVKEGSMYYVNIVKDDKRRVSRPVTVKKTMCKSDSMNYFFTVIRELSNAR